MENSVSFVEVNVFIEKNDMLLRKILQDCDYTKACFREDLCPNSIIRHLFSLLVAKYGT